MRDSVQTRSRSTSSGGKFQRSTGGVQVFNSRRMICIERMTDTKKRKYNELTVQEKVDLIHYKEGGHNFRETADKYNVSVGTACNLVGEREKWIQLLDEVFATERQRKFRATPDVKVGCRQWRIWKQCSVFQVHSASLTMKHCVTEHIDHPIYRFRCNETDVLVHWTPP